MANLHENTQATSATVSDLPYPNQFVRLQRKAPLGVLQAIGDSRTEQAAALGNISSIAGLQEIMTSLDKGNIGQFPAEIEQLQFVAVCQNGVGLGALRCGKGMKFR